jgi:cellulose synthase (UDP-forming)
VPQSIGPHEEPQELPQFLGSERPTPESTRQQLLVRGVALATIVVTFTYLVWRAAGTVDLSVWWIAVPLLLAETHNAIGLTLYTLSLWDVDDAPAWRHVDASDQRIAVLLPTYEEPEDVLLPAIAAAVALEPMHETWVLDDGDRPWVQKLAEELGARYLARPGNQHAKAGNLNHAIPLIDADLLAMFDADHVVQPNFLHHTLGYFDDPTIAVVQTPQDFYNVDSFEHEGTTQSDERPYNEEAIFYRVIGPAKNRWGGAFWCGTGAVVRTTALEEVGLVATDTVTEDIHTTIRMNRRGWNAVYHNEILARGLAPSDASQYMLQRNRWALGAMQVLRKESPLTSGDLTFGQRMAFATTLFGWFDSWRTFTFMVLPMMVVVSGASPIDAPGWLYGPAFATVFLMQFLALRLLARGYYPPITSLLFEVLRMPAVLPATLAVFTSGRGATFKATPKGASEDRNGTPVPWLLRLMLGGSAIALGWFVATIAGITPTTYNQMPATIGAVGFLALNVSLLVLAIRRIRDPRFAGDRRAGVRLGVRLFGVVNGARCEIEDLSTTGAKVLMTSAVTFAPDEAALGVILPDGRTLHLDCEVRRRIDREDGLELGLQFREGQRATLGQISLALLHQRDDETAASESAAA